LSATDTSAAAVKQTEHQAHAANNGTAPVRGKTGRSQQLHDDLELLDAHAERVLADLDARLDEQARRGLRALELAPDLATYRALLRGEQIPIDRLNATAVKRYGLRRPA